MTQAEITALFKDLISISFNKFVKTTDNFCNNYKNNTVSCNCNWYKQDKRAYFHVSGNDDLFYSRSIKCATLSQFIKFKSIYYDLLEVPITINYLLSIGYVQDCSDTMEK